MLFVLQSFGVIVALVPTTKPDYLEIDIYVLQRDLPCFSAVRLVRIISDRNSGEVTSLGHTRGDVRERTQNLSKMLFLLEIMGNNRLRLFSSTPCGKVLGHHGQGEASERSIAAGRVLLCSVCSTLVRHPPPFPGQAVRIPSVLICHSSEQGNRK